MRRSVCRAVLLTMMATVGTTLGCANLSFFNSEHVDYLPDPTETGKLQALEARVQQLELQNEMLRAREVQP